MDILDITKTFPKEESYSLTDQIRRSSRSVTAYLTEAWAKRIYIKSFESKWSDSRGKEFETERWLDHSKLMSGYDKVRIMFITMINLPEKNCKKIAHRSPPIA